MRPLAGSANPKLRPRRPTAQAFPALAPAPPKGILLPPRPHSTPPLDGKGSLSHSTSQESVRVYFVDSHLQNGTGRRLSASAAGRSDGGLVKPKAKMGSLCLSTNPSASTPSLPLVEPPLDQNESQTQAPLTTESPNATLTTSTKLRKCMMRSKSFDDLAQRSSNSALPPVKVERHSSDSVTSVSTKERRGSVETPVVKEGSFTFISCSARKANLIYCRTQYAFRTGILLGNKEEEIGDATNTTVCGAILLRTAEFSREFKAKLSFPFLVFVFKFLLDLVRVLFRGSFNTSCAGSRILKVPEE